jgi:UDP-N-acetylmuramoyl-L-alanyl-D-glutamate--2,6-diaminopimelate ligase
MKSVLSMAKNMAKGRIVTVFGCGGDRDKTKRPIMGKIAADYSDKVIVTSDNSRSERPLAIAYDIIGGIRETDADVDMVLDRETAIKYALENAPNFKNPVMVGDRMHDCIGAKKNNVPCAGVSYGYAEEGELEESGAIKICDSIEELSEYLNAY